MFKSPWINEATLVCVEDFIPADHLARVIKEVVETIDVSPIESRYS